MGVIIATLIRYLSASHDLLMFVRQVKPLKINDENSKSTPPQGFIQFLILVEILSIF